MSHTLCTYLKSFKRIIQVKEIFLSNLQWWQIENQQSPVYDMKWGHFDRVKSTFKMLLSSYNFDAVFKKIRSFDA